MTTTLELINATHNEIEFQTYTWPAFWPVTARCHLQNKFNILDGERSQALPGAASCVLFQIGPGVGV